jgi:hypothetical protein
MIMASGSIAFDRAEKIYASGKYEQAVAMLQDLAAKGNAQAANRLAIIYENGAGVPADPQKAFHLFDKFAMKGDTTAMARLGRMYQYGWTVAPDIPKAVELYRRSSNSGNKTSNLPHMFLPSIMNPVMVCLKTLRLQSTIMK